MWQHALLVLRDSGSKGLGATLAIDGAGDDAAGITGTLAAGVKPLERDVMQQFIITGDAHRGGRARLDTDDGGIVGEETARILAKDHEALAQSVGDERRHPQVEP